MPTGEIGNGNGKSILETFNALQKIYQSSKTESIVKRKKRLKRLLEWIMSNRNRLKSAVYSDFGKPAAEVDISEVYPVIGEIRQALRHLDQWSRPTKVDASITYLGTRSEVRYEPKGVCLIISPWNFPFNLSIGPLVSCLAAGNVALLKPSEETPHTSRLIAEMTLEVFTGEVVTLEGGKELATSLLALPFDHIFFTGSPSVGKIVMKAAAENLSSVTLELGGKSPAIIHHSAKIREAAKRIAFGKFLNNGQTCIAPDYILVHERIKKQFIDELKYQVVKLFGEAGEINENSLCYGRIVNEGHFNRLISVVEDAVNNGATIELSGEKNIKTNFFHPTIISDIDVSSKVMMEEIFGPILPVISFTDRNEVIKLINSKQKPLALYLFARNKSFRETILANTSAGSVCINDCVIQFTHPNLPFGGVNYSGIGKSHGYYGFLAFSNQKPVLHQKSGFALAYFFYPPFSKRMKALLELIIKWF